MFNAVLGTFNVKEDIIRELRPDGRVIFSKTKDGPSQEVDGRKTILNFSKPGYDHASSAYFNETTRKWVVYDNQEYPNAWGSDDSDTVNAYLKGAQASHSPMRIVWPPS